MYQHLIRASSLVKHPLLRSRYQLLGGLLFAIGAPLILQFIFQPHAIYTVNQQITIIAAMTAHTVGFFAHKKLGVFPGIAATGTILPTFAMSYGVVFLFVFLLRLDYSRFQAISCFLMSISWYFGLDLYTRRIETYRMAIVPGGNVAEVKKISGVIWYDLTDVNTPYGRVHGIVVDLRSDLSDKWERFIADRALSGTPVYHTKQITESLTGRVPIEHLSENTLGSLNPNQAYITIKLIIDRIGAGVVLVTLMPFLAVIAIIIKIESPGPAVFRQKRVGFRGAPITVYKFRTMKENAEDEKSDERSKAITKSGDARITKFGRFLRRSRIDEIPQIVNILRGEMSWIGPRPEALVLSTWYANELPFYQYRHIVRPGITGWAQVSQGHVAEVEEVLEKLHYDFYYIKNFSPWLDIVVTLRTVKIILNGFGSK